MHSVFPSILLAASSAFAYQITFPGNSQDWNTTGPNYLRWDRVSTDPLNFTAVLTNMNFVSNQVMDNLIDGTTGFTVCSPPQGGWPSGSAYRVNIVQDEQHLDTILAQSSEFNITSVSSNGSTTSPATATSSATATNSQTSGVSSSDTSTTPTHTSAASVGADTQTGLLTMVAALITFVTALF